MQQSFPVKIATIVLLSLGSVSVAAGSFIITKAANNQSQEQIITDTSLYPEIRNHMWTDVASVKHFPLNIPADAQVIKMAYYHGVNKGNKFWQIRLKEAPDKIQKLHLQYSKAALYKYRGGNTNDHINQANGVATTFFYTGDSSEEKFPNSYEILVLKAQDKSQPGFKWNHAHSYGVAIDISASEIVYWVEKW